MTVTLTITAADSKAGNMITTTVSVPPPVVVVTGNTLAAQMADMVSVWKTDFRTQGLSLRTGGYPQGSSAGYATGKGTWAMSGASYMNNAEGYADFGWGVFINDYNYKWYQSLDPTFPTLAMVDITSQGVVLKGSDGFQAVRNVLPLNNGHVPFLSSYLTAGYAMHIGIPYARKFRFTISSGNFDFPAVWGYGTHEVGGSGGGYEIDDFERFCLDNPASFTAQSTHINGVSAGSRFDTGASLLGPVIETVIVHRADFIYLYTNGVLTIKVPVPSGASTTDVHHPIMNMAVGASWEAYPGGAIGNAALTVQSVEIFAPTSNLTGVFPPPLATPVLAWASGFAGGVIAAPAPGTVVATLSGATTYNVVPYLGIISLATSGSNVVTVGTPAAGAYDFYIEGLDASGIPCLCPKLTATFTNAASIQLIQSLNTAHTNHAINMDIVGNKLYLCAAYVGLVTYDITDRTNPVEIAVIGSAHLNATSGVKVAGNYAFCACEQSNSLTVINLATNTEAAFLQPWVLNDAGTAYEAELAGACSIVLNAAKTIAYISTISRQSLLLVDISVPTTPTVIKEVRSANGPTFWMAGCRDVVINETAGVAYVASEYTNNIGLINISVPASAFIVKMFGNAGNKTQRGLTLNAAQTRLYVVGTGNSFGGMDIWDVSSPQNPVLVNTFWGSSSSNFYGARGVVVFGNFAYICSEYGQTFLVVDISNEAAPTLATKLQSSVLAEMLWMRVQDGYAYIAQFGATGAGTPPGNALAVLKINGYPTPVGT